MRRMSSIILSLIILVPNVILINMLIPSLGFNQNASAFAGGDGSVGNPFQISNVTELQNMSSNLSAHYVLINDIDASSTTTWNWNGTIYKGFIPIANDTDPGTDGFQGTNFTGSFDGRGFNITGLFINNTPDEYIGLFGRINASAVIKNVNMINYTFFGDQYVGGIIGFNNGGTVTNCYTSGIINVPGDYYSDTHYLGGLIGYNLGPVSNCTTRGDINNTGEYAGGLIGENDATVTNCTSYVNVTGEIYGGGYKAGLIGYNIYGAITNCTAYGNILGCYDLGGLLGDSWGPVKNCTAYGNVTGSLQFGGLIGMGGNVVANCSTYGDVRSTGVTWEFALGGLIGSSSATVINCSTYGDIYGRQQVGGLLGLNGNDGLAINCSVYGNTMGLNDSWAVGGLVGQNEEGTVINCIVYGNANSTDSDSYDTGGLVGDNYGGTIKNCISYANTSGYEDVGGLIGWSNGKVVNCTAFGNVNGTGDYTGGLIGMNGGMVTNCSASGSINGISCVGGLIGDNAGTVSNCTTTKYVNGTNHIGGLIGNNDGVVSNCTAYSDINGTHEVAGLIGYNIGTVYNCIAYGNINGEYYLGGLIGAMDDGSVTNCSAFGTVTGEWGYHWFSGGLIGAMNAGKATNCNAFGNVSGADVNTGGLIGWSCGPVTNCNAYGEVYGTDEYAGGLIGENNGDAVNCTAYGNTTGKNYVGALFGASYASVTNCTAYGTATGKLYVGGLIGFNNWAVTNSQAHGTTIGNGSDSYAIGGLIGFNDKWGEAINCTVYNNTSGNSSVGGLIGFNDGWAVTGCTAFGNTIGNSSVGGLVGNNTKTINKCTSYSNTTANVFVGGLVGDNSGTVKECNSNEKTTGNISVGGLIGTNSGLATDCKTFGDTTGNISVGGLIGNNSGTVKNSTSYGNTSGNFNVGGVVGYNKGTVKNCTTFGNVTGTGSDYIGGLVGINNGTIIDSKALGDIKGDFAIGGLIGLNHKSGTVTNCTAFGNVTGLSDVGGLIGNNSGFLFKCSAASNATGTGANIGGLIGSNFGGTISNSSAHGFAKGNINIGGLVGNNNKGFVTDSFSVGNVTGNFFFGGLIGNNSGTVITCFWDNETSGLTTSAGGMGAVGKNTTEMMKQVTFTNAGWDFTNIWGLDEGKTYPFFVFLYNPPFIVNEDVVYATEDSWYFVDYEAIYSTHAPGNDIDEWNLTTNASSWLTINMNGVLSGTPSNNDVGSYWVNVTVTDRYNGKDSHNFTLTVVNVNDPPIITTIDIKSTIEDVFYSVDYNATDIDPTKDTLTWHLETNATWLTIDVLTGNLTGTPTNADVGTYFVNVSVDDNRGGMDFTNFTLIVTNINNLPVIISSNVITATEDTLYSVDYEATDIDIPVNILTWSLTTNATWLNIDSLTGVLSGIPDNNDVGNYFVNVSVKDNKGGLDFTNFSLTVINVNDAPIIITSNLLSAAEDILYYRDYEATDEDPTMDTLTWTLETNAGWLNLGSNTGNLSGTPSNEDVGSYWVNVIVGDGNGGYYSTNFTLTVFNVNDNPIITTTQIPEAANEDLLYSVDFDAEDIDPTDDTLTWYLDTNAGWLSIDSTTGIISGTPSNEDVDLYDVNISVDDGNGGVDFIFYILSVVNVNDPPRITTNDLKTATEDELYTVDYEGIDIDPTADTLIWDLATNANWLEINSITGILIGTPLNDDVGEYWVNVSVDDGNSDYDWSNFSLIVNNVNDPPNISTDDVQIANVNELYSVDYDAIDIDPTNDILTWSLTSNTSNWLTINPESGVLSGTPTPGDTGNYWINITVNDGNGGSDWHYFILMVKFSQIPNQNPVINTVDITTTHVGELYSVKYQATDDRTPVENLDWSMETNATWLSFDTSTHILSGTPEDSDVGTYWINISVDDCEGGIAFRNFMVQVIRIIPENAKPFLGEGKMTPEEGDTETVFTFSVIYTDEENDPGNVWVWIDGNKHQMEPDHNDIDYTDGVEYFHKTKLEKGKHTFYFTANDGTDEAQSKDVSAPTSTDDARDTPKISEPEVEGAGVEDWMLYLIIVIILIILMAIGIFVYKIKKKKEDQIFEDEKQLDSRQEIGEDRMEKEFKPYGDFDIDSYELIKELKQEAIEPEETGEVSLSNQELLDRFEIKYSKGEISEATYDSIKESLIKNEL
jgi:hypothetical protein